MSDEARSALEALDAGWEEDDEHALPSSVTASGLDDLDAGWDIEEERAAALDLAAGLDVEARREAVLARATLRKEKLRAKKHAAKEKRRAKTDEIRKNQRRPKRRSHVPPEADRAEAQREPPRSASAAVIEATATDAEPARPRIVARRDEEPRGRWLLAIAIALGASALAWIIARAR